MRALWLLVALSAAVESQTEVEHRRGGAHRHALQPERRDARDLTRAKDEAHWKDDEKRMEDASAELNKLHAERDRLKEKEVNILSNREAATKAAIEDSTLVIERLEGQVKSQEKELAKQKTTISGLEKDLAMMGQALLSRKEPKEAQKAEEKKEQKEDGNDRLVAGLEKDLQREGSALLAKGDKTIREKLLGREARGLADRARALEQALEHPESAASARPLAAALSQDARKLEHALLRTEDAPRETEDRPNDVARAVELERRPGAAHLEPAELETPERLAAERAEREAQLQRAEEREVQQEQVATLSEARSGRARTHLPRLVHHSAEVADAEPEEAPAVEVPALEDPNATVAEPVEPAVLTEQDADADVADSDVDATAEEEADAAADSADDSADDADAQDDGAPSPGDTMPSDDRAIRLSA